MTDAALVLLAYLTGSIPMAYVVGRAARKIDIRRYGSGNAGASNVWVQVGKRTALSVGAFDVFVKGSLPTYVAWEFGTSPWIAAAAGLAAVAGHNWSAYLGLTGGRGVTVATGVMLVLAWKELIALLLVALCRVASVSQQRALGGHCRGVDACVEFGHRRSGVRNCRLRRPGSLAGSQACTVQRRVAVEGRGAAQAHLPSAGLRQGHGQPR